MAPQASTISRNMARTSASRDTSARIGSACAPPARMSAATCWAASADPM
jgi:hypothetical protein